MAAHRTVFVLTILLCAGCMTDRAANVTPAGARVPLFEGLGDHHRVVSADPRAQRYFDQGLTLAFAFNHDEAIRSFEQAAEFDPQCAMAWWGVALCNGPHINNPVVPEERGRAAWQALGKALALADRVGAADRALIGALTKRYADPPPAERGALDAAYADAMRAVYRAHPDDTDVGTLYAEALMDLQPWDLWTPEGQPKGRTLEILSVLERVMKLDADHPGALHLYIHATESSPRPDRGAVAADRLRRLVPGAGHLVHMPSHIDVVTGRWAKAVEQNELAIEADRKYRSIAPRQGFYHVYMAHNHHMLTFASMMEGRSEAALRAARELVAGVPEDYAREQPALVDPFMSIVSEVLMRFGRWEEVLRQPRPAEQLPISTALWHFARGVALANTNRLAEAEAERTAFEQAVGRVPENATMMLNRAHQILAIAGRVLDGEIAYRRGQIDRAVEELTAGVRLEDELRYMEPPEWIQPVRHTLGAVLLEAGRLEEAERVYREDLAEWPENGWSLYGLSQCLKRRGATAEAAALERRFAKAFARADVKIHASCLCVRGNGVN